jgi:hypothetical protein
MRRKQTDTAFFYDFAINDFAFFRVPWGPLAETLS